MFKLIVNAAATAALFMAGPALAQVQTIDPNQADNYSSPSSNYPSSTDSDSYSSDADTQHWSDTSSTGSDWTPVDSGSAPPAPMANPTTSSPAPTTSTVPREDVFTAAEDVFGRGAEGLAGLLENILRDQGEPTAYISGQEAGGALVFGVRYGSGTMRHSVEGDRAVYWTGPSLGFDLGADANKVFVLVYNLHDSQELFKRFPGAEGNAYFVGGFTAQYLRRGDVVLIPIRLGVGLRLGINAGYMRFSQRNRWLPF